MPPGRGSAAGQKVLALPYYNQHTVFVSPSTFFRVATEGVDPANPTAGGSIKSGQWNATNRSVEISCLTWQWDWSDAAAFPGYAVMMMMMMMMMMNVEEFIDISVYLSEFLVTIVIDGVNSDSC